MQLRHVTGFIALLGVCTSYTGLSHGWAQETGAHSPYSTNISGQLGLNTVPNARVDKASTLRAGVSTLDPFIHSYLGVQIAAPLSITLRQTGEVSNINDADRLYPGMDMKLRLLQESRSRPEIALGIQSMLGHQRMGGEYIALSKRYKDFDFTGGLGWGRYGTAGHFKNPLKGLHKHFGKPRALSGEKPVQAHDWFTGEKVGLFGGIEYFTPIKGLSAKLDWGADRYSAEKTGSDFDPGAPWGLGLNYKPRPWIDLGIGMQGTDKVMGRLSLQSGIDSWPTQAKPHKTFMRPYRTGIASPLHMRRSANKDGVKLYYPKREGYHGARAKLSLNTHSNAPHQIGQAAVHMSNHAGPSVEKLSIQPTILNLRGPNIQLTRADIERATTRHHGSPEEIWRSTKFSAGKFAGRKIDTSLTHETLTATDTQITLENQLSLAEDDSAALYRTAVLVNRTIPTVAPYLSGLFGLRVNLLDNLQNIRKLRTRNPKPVRSDVDIFAERTTSIERSAFIFTHSFQPDLHLSLMGGYLEEMYAGGGGEILYRPFRSRLAIGLEAWDLYKRDPFTALNLGFDDDNDTQSAHINFWYDVPRHDLTLHAKVGHYLAEDTGMTLGLQKHFRNGATLEGFLTLSDEDDFDIFGDTTHAHSGLRFRLPLRTFKSVPTQIKMNLEPFGRDSGQILNNPAPLYELTTPFSYAHMARHWQDIIIPNDEIVGQ